jgi:TolB-like protein/DNA-binding winged helix-turn-helix (wHTH) protein/Flp pilus assembly protein TadD
MDTRTSQAFTVGATAQFRPPSGELRVGDRAVRLRPQSAAVLTYLLLNPERVVCKEELLETVWPGVVVTENSLAQCIAEIRRELGGANERAIETVPKRGYRFHPPAPRLQEDRDRGRYVEPRMARLPMRPRAAMRRRPFRLATALGVILIAGGTFWWHLTSTSSEDVGRPSPRLSLAVLPLTFEADDQDQAVYASRVAEDLATDLARVPGVQVIARTAVRGYQSGATNPREAGRELGVRYVVEGGVMREAGRLLVNLRLIEADTGVQRWSERIDMDTGLMQIEDRDVSGRIAQTLLPELVAAGLARQAREPQYSSGANDLALRAWMLSKRGSQEDNANAQALARQAISLDPEALLAWQVLAASNMLDRVEGWSADPDGALDRAEAAVRRALAINSAHPQLHTILGAIMAVRGRYAEAVAAFETELAMGSRHDPQVHEWLGITYLLMGKPRQAIKPLETAIWLSPRDPRLSTLWRTLAMAHVHIGDLCFARDRAWSAVRTARPAPRAYETLAAVCTMYGDTDCANEALAELLRISPRHSISLVHREVSSRQPDFVARQHEYVAALRTAGLP